MNQFLHVLVVDRARHLALAQPYGSKWLLPIIVCTDRARVTLAVRRWCGLHGIPGDPVGQWLGRLAASGNAIDWLVVIRTGAPATSPASARLSWVHLDRLRTSISLSDYQQWAIAQALSHAGAPAVPGPFGSMEWLDDIIEWIRQHTKALSADSRIVYRAGAHEVVLGITSMDGALFFKGLVGARIHEAQLTSRLSTMFPQAFARTLGMKGGPDGSLWWLAAGCAGVFLADRFTLERAQRVAIACARIQKRLARSSNGASDLPPTDISAAAQWSVELLRTGDACTAVDRCCHGIDDACSVVTSSAMPWSWMPLDLDPSNVLLDEKAAVHFIDLDESSFGPALVSMLTFVRRCRQFHPGGRDWSDSARALIRAYEREWLHLRLESKLLWAVDVVSNLLESYSGWQRMTLNAERGELHGPLDLIANRMAGHLLRVISAQS